MRQKDLFAGLGARRALGEMPVLGEFAVAQAAVIVVYCARLRKKDMKNTFEFAWFYYFGFTAGAARAC